MAFSVTEMISKGLKNGVAKTSNFEVLITPPPALLNYTDIARELIYKADSVEIPGRTTLTIDHKFSNMGPINKIPYSQIYPDVTITFMLSDDFREKMFFDELYFGKVSIEQMIFDPTQPHPYIVPVNLLHP